MEPGDLFLGAGREAYHTGGWAMTAGVGAGVSMARNGCEVDGDADVVQAASVLDFDFAQVTAQAGSLFEVGFMKCERGEETRMSTRIDMSTYMYTQHRIKRKAGKKIDRERGTKQSTDHPKD